MAGTEWSRFSVQMTKPSRVSTQMMEIQSEKNKRGQRKREEKKDDKQLSFGECSCSSVSFCSVFFSFFS